MSKPDDHKPSYSEGVLDVEGRRREKQAARDRDEADIRSGRRTAAEVARANSFFGALDVSKAKIITRRAKIRIDR